VLLDVLWDPSAHNPELSGEPVQAEERNGRTEVYYRDYRVRRFSAAEPRRGAMRCGRCRWAPVSRDVPGPPVKDVRAPYNRLSVPPAGGWCVGANNPKRVAHILAG
jgi:hypothetical protein